MQFLRILQGAAAAAAGIRYSEMCTFLFYPSFTAIHFDSNISWTCMGKESAFELESKEVAVRIEKGQAPPGIR